MECLYWLWSISARQYQPRYNILLKDSKGFPYIRLSPGDYPRFSLAAKAEDDGARYFGPYARVFSLWRDWSWKYWLTRFFSALALPTFGPYGSRFASQGIIDALRQALRLPGCRRKFPRARW